jgi:adenosine deaminase
VLHVILSITIGSNSLETVRLIPKVELHAHLHGSIRTNTLTELAHEYRSEAAMLLESNRDLEKCFGIFDLIHRTISGVDAVRRVVREVLEDFMNENVIYLELRTTPRKLTDGTNREQYLDVVLSVISEHNALYGDRMVTRLLLSIDRAKSMEENQSVLQLALQSREKFGDLVVGIDLSGNPMKGNVIDELLPILQQCRDAGFRITMHAAEVPELDYPCDLVAVESKNLSVISMNGARNCITNGYISPMSSVGEISAIIAFRCCTLYSA